MCLFHLLSFQCVSRAPSALFRSKIFFDFDIIALCFYLMNII